MVEAHGKRIFKRNGATKTYTTKQCKLPTAFKQQANQLQEIFIPPHRNAVFSNTAKTRHGTRIERLM